MVKDPDYPDALAPTEPEFANDKERADYFEKLAKGYGAKISALKWVLKTDFELYFDDTGELKWKTK